MAQSRGRSTQPGAGAHSNRGWPPPPPTRPTAPGGRPSRPRSAKALPRWCHARGRSSAARGHRYPRPRRRTPADRPGGGQREDTRCRRREVVISRPSPKKLRPACRSGLARSSPGCRPVTPSANQEERHEFISIFTHEPRTARRREAEMAAMGKLVEDAMKEGWLLQTEGVSFGAKGFRVHKSAGGKCHGHRRPVRGGQGGHRRLRAAEGEFQGGDRQATRSGSSRSPARGPARSTSSTRCRLTSRT